MKPGPLPEDHRDVSLREMVEAMSGCPDDETFRWLQTSYVAADGSIHASTTLRVTVGQARREIGILPSQ